MNQVKATLNEKHRLRAGGLTVAFDAQGRPTLVCGDHVVLIQPLDCDKALAITGGSIIAMGGRKLLRVGRLQLVWRRGVLVALLPGVAVVAARPSGAGLLCDVAYRPGCCVTVDRLPDQEEPALV